MQSHPDLFHNLFLSVIPEPIVNPMSYQLQWGLGAKCILGWHVQVIQKCQQLLATKRDINTCKRIDHCKATYQNYEKKVLLPEQL